MKKSIVQVLAVTVAAAGFSSAWAQQEATGAGATFPAPLYSKWASDYNKATGVKVNYQSVGSGAGIKQIEAKTVDFGASDMPLKDEDLKAKGVNFNEVSPQEQARMRDVAKPVIDKFSTEYDPAIVKLYNSELSRIRQQ